MTKGVSPKSQGFLSPQENLRRGLGRSHLLAAVYVGLSALWVLVLEGRWGYELRFETVDRFSGAGGADGGHFNLHIGIPLAFWGLTALFVTAAYWSRKSQDRSLKDSIRTVVPVAFLLQAVFLLLDFQQLGFGRAGFPSRLHDIYAWAAVALGLLIAYWMAFRTAGLVRTTSPPAERLALLYLPVVAFVTGSPGLNLGLFFLAGLGYWGVSRWSGIGRRVWSGLSGRRREILLVSLVLMLAVGIRFAGAWRMGHHPPIDVILNWDDGQNFHPRAFALYMAWVDRVDFEGLPQYDGALRSLRNLSYMDGTVSQGYIFFLGFLYLIFGVSLLPALLTQSVLGALAALLAYLLGRRLFGKREALLGSLLVALSHLLIFHSINLAAEALTLILYPLMLLLALQLKRTNLFRQNVIIGFVFGLTAHVNAIIWPFGIVLLLWSRLSLGVPWRAFVKGGGAFLGGLFLALLPVGMLYQAQTGEARVLTKAPWTAQESWSRGPYAEGLETAGIQPFKDQVLTLKTVFTHPIRTVSLWGFKSVYETKRLFFEGNIGEFDPIFLLNRSFLHRNWIFYGYIFAFLGLAFGFSRSIKMRKDRWLVFLLLFYHSALYTVFFVGRLRYLVPIEPILLVFLAHGILVLWTWTGGTMKEAGLRPAKELEGSSAPSS
jgi:hypothetical protein